MNFPVTHALILPINAHYVLILKLEIYQINVSAQIITMKIIIYVKSANSNANHVKIKVKIVQTVLKIQLEI